MAGAGYKLFNTGDVLTAAQVNTYLQEQTVMVFANSTARTTALSGVLAEGMVSYLQDTNAVEVYNGSAWVSLAADQTPLTTKGDLFTFSTVDARLGVGANGTVLTADSAETTGLKWAAPASSGVNKNYLINGGFAISQRGTSFTSTGGANNDDAYTLDRWYILSDTNDVIDVTQDTSTVPTNGQFAIALDVETVNKKFGIASIIENKDVIGLVGNTVTFSFKAKVSSTTKLDNVKAAIVAWSGTADSVTSDIVSAWNVEGTNPTLIANATYENTPANLSLTTSYATYSISAAVDTASTKNLILFVWSDVTDTTLGDFLYIAESKLELGSSATAFQYAGGTIAGELDACQRYYAVTNGFSGIGDSTTAVIFNFPFAIEMRANPSVSASAALQISTPGFDYNQSAADISIAYGRISKQSGTFLVANYTGLTQYRGYNHNVGQGNIIFSAEL